MEILISYDPETAPPSPEPFVDEYWYQDCEADAELLDEIIFRDEFAAFLANELKQLFEATV